MTQKVVVATGWWSPETRSEWSIGDDRIRSPEFFALWHRQVIRYLAPDLILVTDSRSPRKPDWTRFDRVRVIELDQNYGHGNDLRRQSAAVKFGGFTRSVLMGATYAFCCDADYFVYVEQDCLIRGERFLEACIASRRYPFYCGMPTVGGRGLGGRPAAPMLQQSVQIATRQGMARLIAKTASARRGDGEVSPEIRMARDMKPYGLIGIPYGRSRPIDFAAPHYYAQHLELDELRAFLDAEGLAYSDWF